VTATYTDAELAALETLDRRRTVTHLLDIHQRHLEEFTDPHARTHERA